MPISRSGSSTGITDSGTLSGTTPTEHSSSQQKGSLNGSDVSLSEPTKQLPKTDAHPSALHATAKPILSRRAKVIKAIKSLFNRCLNALKDNSLTRRFGRHNTDTAMPSVHWGKNDSVTITTNISDHEEDIPKSASNVKIAPRMAYEKEEPALPFSGKVAFKKAAPGDEDDSVELLRSTASDLKAKQGKRAKAREKVKGIAELTKTHYFGSVYPKKGMPAELLLKYQKPALIIVKGSEANPAGHALLGFESPEGERFYTQINNLRGYPEHMTEEQCAKYIAVESGGVLLEYRPPFKASSDEAKENTENMQTKINDYAKGRWQWSGTLHNCYSYCLHILKAGGYDTNDLEGWGLARFPLTAIDVAQKKTRQQPPASQV